MKAKIKFTTLNSAGQPAPTEGHTVPTSFPSYPCGPLSFSKGEIMKTAKSIVELATEIQRQSESKKDFIVPTQAVDPSGQTLTGRDEMSKDFKFSRDWIEHCKEWRKEKSEKGEPSSLAQYKLQHGLMSKQEYVKNCHCCVCEIDLYGEGSQYSLPEGFRRVCRNCNTKGWVDKRIVR